MRTSDCFATWTRLLSPVVAALLWIGSGVARANVDLNMYSWSITPTTVTGYGTPITVNYRARNAGTDPSGAFYVAFYYGDSTSTSPLTLLGTYSHTSLPGLSTGGTVTKNMTLPANVLYGTRYIHYFVDYNGSVAESNEDNNRGYRTMSITGRPDLQVPLLLNIPSAQYPNHDITTTYRIYNAGYTRVPSLLHNRFYFSTDATITTSDTSLGSVDCASLNARSYYPAAENGTLSLTIPSTASAGTRYIGAFADYDNQYTESWEHNNTRAAAIAVLPEKPDLSLTSLLLTPDTVDGSGDSVSASFVVNNSGAADASSFYVAFYYAPSSTFTNTTYCGQYHVPSLSAGTNSGALSLPLAMPGSIRRGTGYVHAWADHAGSVDEINEHNNKRAKSITATGKPNLQIYGPSLAPTMGRAGQPVDLLYRVRNVGKTACVTPFDVRILYSDNAHISLSDTPLATEAVPSTINVNASWPTMTSRIVPVDVPSNAPPGVRYIGAYADCQAVVDEADEADNSEGVAMQVYELKLCDIAVVPGAGIELAVTGTLAVESYEIRFCTNLMLGTWYVCDPTGINVPGSNGMLRWTDEGTPDRDLDTLPQIYYRVKVRD